jgi:hypothetical protein
MIFSFGQPEEERIEIDVHGYERPPSGEYWDDNWLKVDIRVSAGGFRGKVSAAIITSELSKFVSDLRPLYETLSGSAQFETMEQQLPEPKPAAVADFGRRFQEKARFLVDERAEYHFWGALPPH